MKILESGMADIEKLEHWEKNPRRWTPERLEELKHDITRLSMYKPVIIDEEGTVIGGNIRLDALRQLGFKKIWVSMVEARTFSDKLFFAISDNDKVGFTDREKLISKLDRMDAGLLEQMRMDMGFGQSLAVLVRIAEEARQEDLGKGGDENNIHKISLPFTNAEYVKVMKSMERVMPLIKAENHTEAIISLLNIYAETGLV